MTASKIMFQGTGSDVGKSLIVAGLCRLLSKRGLKVVPFKPQNMSNNAAIADDGGEIGRAQWLQALAANIPPSIHMNPVLLKPQSDKTSQIILRGKLQATMSAKEYHEYRKSLLPSIIESYELLAKDADIVLIEGAGSPAEINLRKNDIANMGFTRAINSPVVLIGDIERGGVIASLVGTHTVLEPEDRKMIKGFIVNKFRGDSSLFTSAEKEIEKHTGWKNLGLIPHFPALTQLPQEDSMALSSTSSINSKPQTLNPINIVALHTPHIANFDDFSPLSNDPYINFSWCKAGENIPTNADVVILAGSKSTIADLNFIRSQGWDIDLVTHKKRGGKIIGICGGYQMLGKTVSDPYGVEGNPESVEGLGFLDIETVFERKKITKKWQGFYQQPTTSNQQPISVSGYETHMGISSGKDFLSPMFCSNQPEGAISPDGLVWGSYVHGIFANDDFRKTIFNLTSNYQYMNHLQEILDEWANVLENNIDVEKLLKIANLF